MKIFMLCVGKTKQKFVSEGVELFRNRLQHYTSFEILETKDIKNGSKLNNIKLKEEEGNKLLSFINPSDYVVLLDEKGKGFTSIEFASFIEKIQLRGVYKLFFVVGGAYGFSDAMYKRADVKIQLSKMTFSHQIIRCIFSEQLYRALTIIKGEKYHNE